MSRPHTAPEVLSTRRLNRALLARQGLLDPWNAGILDTIQRLIGLQSQAPHAAYAGLWTRLAEFDPNELSALLADRQVVRIALMRSTLFLVSAADCLALRPVMQQASIRAIASSAGKRTREVDLARLMRRARELLEREPLTLAELGVMLEPDFPPYAPADLATLVRVGLPLVQVPPRGLWGRSGRSRHTTAESWLGRPLGADSAPDEAILRYLQAFGPATVSDIQTWSGLTGLRAAIERLRPGLRSFRNERGQELLDVANGLLPGEDTDAPVRILPEFDNCLLSHADRSRIFDDRHRMRFITQNGLVSSTVLVDGFVAATCRVHRAQDRASLLVEPLAPLRRQDRSAVRLEGLRCLAFLAQGAKHEVVFVE